MRIVFFGDSLTEGIDGASYLRVLGERAAADPGLRGVEMINAGVGGDTTEHLLARLERDVLAQRPDAVVVFVGANDCTTLLLRRGLPTPTTLRSRAYFRRQKGLRGAVTPERYAAALRAIAITLHARTAARIALCTPATIGEVPGSPAWRTIERYAAAVRAVAAESHTDLLDPRAAFARELATYPHAAWLWPLCGIRALVGELRARKPAVRARGIEALARARGLRLTYDGVHLTARGAELVAEVIWPWLVAAVAGNGDDISR